MLPSHLNGHCPLARRLSAASPPAADGSSTAGAGAGAGTATTLEEHDRIYFQSYSHIAIHEAMIKAREIVKANNLSDQIVVIHGRVETILYFFDPAEVKQDQVIEGSITVSERWEPLLSEY